jgi:hypothetical protein
MRLLKWHRAFMRGENPPMHDADPQCGWYRTQMVKNGPWVPVEIWCDRDIDESGELEGPEILRADAFGKEVDVDEIWTWLTPISRQEFNELRDMRLKNEYRFGNTTNIDLSQNPTPPGGLS